MFKAISPVTGEVLSEHEAHDEAHVEQALSRAVKAFESWRERPLKERAAVLRAAAGALRGQRATLAALMTAEMGKPLKQALAEVDKCAWVCEHYAEIGPSELEPLLVQTDATLSMVRHDPLGPVFAIMPWNFPLWQVFRFAAPTLMAGNVVVLKHASNVPGCALAIETLWRAAGAPQGAFQTLLIDHERAEALIDDPRIRAVTLTGSVRAGRAVAAAAGRALKPVVLELGGSDPFVILDDADVDEAVQAAIQGRFQNNGQSCIAAKRFIAVAEVYDRFEAQFTEAIEALSMGDPTSLDVDLGPMSSPSLREELQEQVRRSVEAGARCVVGGTLPEGPGAYYPATLLVDVRPGMAAFDEELFGPVAALIRAEDEQDALRLANHSSFGLGASVWCQDMHRGLRWAEQLEAGAIAVNGIVKSDPRLPFGGIKHSGLGRELAVNGLLAFCNVKSVWIA